MIVFGKYGWTHQNLVVLRLYVYIYIYLYVRRRLIIREVTLHLHLFCKFGNPTGFIAATLWKALHISESILPGGRFKSSVYR